jgi:uncharacterized protein YndB with AHSA1/START domain
MSSSPTFASPAAAGKSRDIVIIRVFDAPRELVWQAWTDPARFMRWWGPKDFTSPACKIDLRAGGRYHACMRTPDGQDMWTAGRFLEVAPPDRLVYTDSFADADGNVVSPTQYGFGEDFPAEVLVTVHFADHAGGTKMTLIHAGLPAGEISDMTMAGWNESFDKLAASLDKPFVISRVFDAPRELVWEALTEPGRMAAWFGPKGFTGRTIRMDLRPGGVYHYHLAGPGGLEMWARWIYREIVPLERLVFVQSFSDPEGGPGPFPFPGEWPAEMLCTFALAGHGGKTEFTVRTFALDPTPAQAAAFNAGFASMTGGWAGTFDQLEDHLAGMRP